MLKVVYGMRCDCALAPVIFHTTFWPMSICEDSKPGLVLKDIRRLKETTDGRAAEVVSYTLGGIKFSNYFSKIKF